MANHHHDIVMHMFSKKAVSPLPRTLASVSAQSTARRIHPLITKYHMASLHLSFTIWKMRPKKKSLRKLIQIWAESSAEEGALLLSYLQLTQCCTRYIRMINTGAIDKTQRSSRWATNKICACMRRQAYIDWEMRAEPRSKESKAQSDAKNKIRGASALQRATVRVRLETQVLWVMSEPDVNDGKKFYCRPTTKSEFSWCRVKPLRCLKNTLLWNKFPSHFLSKHIRIILNWNDKCWLSIGTSWLLLSLMWWPERHCPAMGTPCLQCNQEASRSELTNDSDFTSGCSDFE